MAGTGVGKFSSTASNNTSNLTVNFAENMAPSNVNNAARELMGHMRDMYEQLGDGYFEFGDGDGEYTVTRGDADTITITGTGDITSVYYVGRKIRITDGGGNVVEGVISGSSHSSTTQTIDLTGISLASGTPTKVELGIDTAAFGGKVILDDDGDTYIEAPTDDTIDIYVAGAKDFVITANTFTAESGSTIAAQALTATTVTATGEIDGASLDIEGDADINGTTNLDIVDIDGAVNMATTALVTGVLTTTAATVFNGGFASNAASTITTADNTDTLTLTSTDADATVGPNLRLYRNSSSPADSDDIGAIRFDMRNDNSQDFTAAQITGDCGDISDGTEDAEIHFDIMTAGTLREYMRLSSGNIIFNEGSQDIDFRVESDGNTHMLFVDGGNNRISMGNQSPSDCGAIVTISSGDSGATVNGTFDAFCIEGDGTRGMSILTPNDQTGGIVFGDPEDNDAAAMQYNHANNAMILKVNGNSNFALRIDPSNIFSTNGETAPDAGIGGITLNQGGGDTGIITLKSSDVAHGQTGGDETDTYAKFQKVGATVGGLKMQTYSEGETALKIDGRYTTDNTTKGTGASCPVQIDVRKIDGTSVTTPGADANMFSVTNNGQTKFIVDEDGDIHNDGSVTAYDNYEDAQLVRAFDLSHGKGVIDSKFDKFISYNHEALADMKLVGREEDGTPNHFVNVTGMQRLHNGAIWQQYEKTEKLANAMYELAKAAVGEEKANKILEQNEIKLLN